MNLSRKVTVACGLIMAFAASSDLIAGEVWPGFRGWGDGHSRATNLPLSWQPRGRGDGNWTIRLPGYGQSSPVVWKDRIFVTAVSGAEKESLHLLAVSLDDGAVLWQLDFQGTQRVKDSDTVSRAAPTPVLDEERVYAVFESGDIHAVTHDGQPVWHRSFVADYGELKGPHGYASSPRLVDDLLVVQVAHSGPSYIMALEKLTGENRWKVEHPSQTGWSSPAVNDAGEGKTLFISTAGSVRVLQAETGEELWHLTDVMGNTTASPTIAGDLVLIGVGAERGGTEGGRGRDATRRGNPGRDISALSGGAGERERTVEAVLESNEDLAGRAEEAGSPVPATSGRASLAIRFGGNGTLGHPQILWRAPRVSVGYSSPLVVNGHAYFVNHVGVLQCVDLDTGELLWQHRLPSQVWASPIAHDGHLVVFCKDGQVVTLASGPKLREVAESQLSATDIVYGIAAVDGCWIVRTGRGLVRVTANAPASESLGVEPTSR